MRLLAFAFLSLFLITGCVDTNPIRNPMWLPIGATNIIDKGNNWYTFELDGTKFLIKVDPGDSRRNMMGTMNLNAPRVVPLGDEEKDRSV